MSMFKRVKVIMLPSNQLSKLHIVFKEKLSITKEYTKEYPTSKPQHLYIISDEEIKEGDWYYNEKVQKILRGFTTRGLTTKELAKKHNIQVYKIIATTDSSLYFIGNIEKSANIKINLPQPSQSFIEKYVEAYNSSKSITEVDVEYEHYNKPENGYSSIHRDYKLKVNPKDNTITIKKIKDNFILQELELRMMQYGNYVSNKVLDTGKPIYKSSKEWLEENL